MRDNIPHSSSNTTFSYLYDEKRLMMHLLMNQFISPVSCNSKEGMYILRTLSLDIYQFFIRNKQLHLKECSDSNIFSHCQLFYIFQYDSGSRQCHSYYHEKCMSINAINNRYRSV